MVSRRQLFAECCTLIEKSGTDSADFDTLCIFQDVLGEKTPMFAPEKEVSEANEKIIRELAEKRSQGQPLQYLLGEWEFYGYNFKVGEGVLIPRPDTETLIEQVLDICRTNGLVSPKIADLCSGSGCIAITLKKEIPSADVYAIELSDKAFGYLRENVRLNNADITVIHGDVLDIHIREDLTDFDIIVSNPPYLTQEDMDTLQTEVTYEPALALFGGSDGLDFYRNITKTWRRSLKKGGWLCYEYGFGQHDDVKKILLENKFENITLCRDLGNIFRTAAAQKTEV